MRAFVFVCLSLTTVLSAPQGYSYQQQQQGGGFLQSSGSATSHTSSNSLGSLEAPSFLQEALQNTKLMQSLLGSVGGGQSNFQSAQSYQQPQYQQQQQSFGYARPQQQLPTTQYQTSFGQQQQQQQPQYQQAYNQPSTSVTKDIYVHVAPEEPAERYRPAPPPVAPPRKHYRIVFIKAPSPSVSSAALRVNQAPSEEKTIIYVLTKKPDPIDFETTLQEAAPRLPSKPEVYFIKYKTQAEAQHAQRTIQAQYDQLGGTTQVSDEGVAPVTSVIGALDQQQQQQQQQQFGTGSGTTGAASYSGSSNFASSVNIASGTASGGSSSSSSKYLPPIRA